MQKQADIMIENHHLVVTGDLQFANVMLVYQKSLQQISSCHELVFDFSRLQSSDSSGLALMVEWIRLARQQNKKIRFEHLSEDILSIAKAAGIDGMFNGKNG
ncbi:hypothetical protein AQUSIP_14200 [Aquicella siphonis]|uniref:STAS domain-containing protein n=1 Tax=Aquicella siphonis TaxID=254247 RepID=A0A5E4PHP1_9COXI|nr:STAS domain-containing protein [Aquicella siphonis]VVC76115.1 hypothetical protein AQUSIP_14200 [Aquicella siphonis]